MSALWRRYPKILPWLVGLLALAAPARASHLLGGEMTYSYLGANGPAAAPLRYEITLAVYVTCNNTVTSRLASITIYNQATGQPLTLTATNYSSVANGKMSVPETSVSACTTPYIPPGCTITGANQPYILQQFVAEVNLPQAAGGYYATYTIGNRNAGITNLDYPSSESLTLYVSLAPPIYANHSPVFVGNAVAFICANDTTVLLNNAVDADGDRLVYAFGQPYSSIGGGQFVPPPYGVAYSSNSSYAATTPLGTDPGYYAAIEAASGITRFRAVNVGEHYAVAVDVQEYRTVNGQEVLLGITRRDVQLVVGNCPTTVAPALPPPATLPRSYTIEAGSTLTIPLTATQAGGHPLTLTASSVLLDGSGPYQATLNGNAGTLAAGSPVGSATATGTGTVTGTFVYATKCGDARATPYDVTLLVQDTGCAGKLVAAVFSITVTKPSGPTAIGGPTTVCGLGTTQTYTASGGTAAISWRLSGGGSFASSSTASPVQVRWATPGTYTLTARGIGQYGCLTDSVRQTITVQPALAVAGPLLICQGGSTTLTPSGNVLYTLSSGATILSGPGPFVVSPAQTTTYTLTGTANIGGPCPNIIPVTVTVLPLPQASVGANPRTTCPGAPLPLGAPPVAGNTYRWTPATGLSSATAANPTLTLPNLTGAPLTLTYTLTETNAANCSTTNSVTVTVLPSPIAVPGPDLTLCSGSPGQLGAPPLPGLSYRWSPATGLSSATIANPTVLLTNPASTPATYTYTLTVTSPALSCPGVASATVTVNPALLPGSIGSDQVVCSLFAPAPLTELTAASGGTGTYGYQWEASPDNSTWTPIAGATNPTYAPSLTAAITYLRRRVGSGDCALTFTNSVQLSPQLVLTSAVVLPTLPAQCAGTTLTFKPVPVDAGPAPTYRWLVNGVPVATTATFASATLADGDQVTVEVTPTAGFCASGPATATTTVRLIPVPLPTLTISCQTPMPVCEGTALVFSTDQVSNPSATPQYQWLVDGQPVAGATGATYTSGSLREGQLVALKLTAATPCGPRSATSAGVVARVDAAVDVDAGPDQDLMLGDEVTLTGTANGSYPVLWSPALGLSSTTTLHPVASPEVTTTYTLTAVRGQCTDESRVTIVVRPRLRIPSAFSPNGDGTDDTWEIGNLAEYVGNHVTVFNRWGTKLFEAHDYGHGNEWNGTTQGQPAPLGTYYYIIQVKNHSYTGPITVVY